MGDLIQPWSPSLITQTLMAEAELADDVISLSRPCPSAASDCGVRRSSMQDCFKAGKG